jgi:hypothetical protein
MFFRIVLQNTKYHAIADSDFLRNDSKCLAILPQRNYFLVSLVGDRPSGRHDEA